MLSRTAMVQTKQISDERRSKQHPKRKSQLAVVKIGKRTALFCGIMYSYCKRQTVFYIRGTRAINSELTDRKNKHIPSEIHTYRHKLHRSKGVLYVCQQSYVSSASTYNSLDRQYGDLDQRCIRLGIYLECFPLE